MVTEAEVKCEACGGKGFTEYESGLIQVECSECHGIGRVSVSPLPKFNHAEAIKITMQAAEEGKAKLKQEAAELGLSIEEAVDDSSSRIRRSNKPVGGQDTGKSTQPGKPKAPKKTRKGSS